MSFLIEEDVNFFILVIQVIKNIDYNTITLGM